jgi:hypothetical protein
MFYILLLRFLEEAPPVKENERFELALYRIELLEYGPRP